MPTIRAIPCIKGAMYYDHSVAGEITDDLHPDIIGEIVTQAVQKFWKAGNDPVTFTIVVEFSQ